MTNTKQSNSASSVQQRDRYSWRVVDIVVASVIGVASGIIFWAWGQLFATISVPLAFLPGLSGLLVGGWLFAGVLGGLVVRKPGAALFTELLAAFVSMVVGTQWGWTVMLSGLIQGLAIELGFALFLYANWKLMAAIVAGAAGGAGLAISETVIYYAANDSLFKTVYIITAVVSGIVLAGIVSWLAMRAIAATGALSRFAAGREQTQRV